MINANDIKEFKNKLYETEKRYFNLIDEKEKGEMTFSDKNTITIWEVRIKAIERMMIEIDKLEFELFV